MSHHNQEKERSFVGIDQLSLRSIILGMIGSAVITASSMYVALRLSALPWPTIFVAVLSMALLKLLGKTTHNEINITQTSMSAGAMVAGGLAFTLPGLWITGVWSGQAFTPTRFWQVLAISICGVLLGSVLTWYLRRRFVEKEPLPYPIGIAAADTIVVGDAGNRKSALLFISMGVSAVFTFLRDHLAWIPGALSSQWLYARNFFIGIAVSPMAVSIGYMIGTLYTGVWFLGAVIAYVLIIPAGPALGLFSSVDAAVNFKNTAGIGLMVGTGVGTLIAFMIGSIKKRKQSRAAENAHADFAATPAAAKRERIWTVIAVAIAFVFSIVSGLGVLPSILMMIGVLAASAMSAIITGQTGINPMEIFAIIVLLAVRVFVDVNVVGSFFIAAAVAVACGYAGDLLNDYKTGAMLKTNPKAQLISQIAGGIVGAVIATLAMFAVIGQFGGVGPGLDLPAGQAFAVSQMVGGIGEPLVFWVALGIGVLLNLLKVPSMTLGIGMYLPFELSAIVFLGGLVRLISDRFFPKAVGSGSIVASGTLGGEGITGVAIAIIKMIAGA
ncbi:MAG TPA: peptide transporter [Firmicutes bacterium]|jgi:putative OPT family oligopeptide transporter|nr:peptide transporter [Bacillota bacterium]HAW70425.1 peptide transporter [Bacillota bacterium]HAZ21509.1 peptide transporter [Bacillota bacterium]HBE05645.1 peptide transporter [Bacillota bacterium]HBL68827.1 peptide transporter [Bacillota bacterium]